MSKREKILEQFKEEMNSLGLSYHQQLYDAIADHLGPSIYDNDGSKVACSDKEERNTIKENFLIGKLGLEDSPELDDHIEHICHALGQSNRHKHRVTFYYLLTSHLQMESVMLKGVTYPSASL